MTETRPINPLHIAWLEDRKIDPEHALAMGIYSARPAPFGGKDREPIPDIAGNILAFPYFEGGKEVNAKFRAPGKKFFQREGCRKTFYNADIIDDPALTVGTVSLVITEGEPDAVISIQCGHPHTISCPDGAPPDRDANGRIIPMRPDDEIDPENDSKFGFVFNNWARLEPVKRIILATDGDGPGMRLRDELARRLGRVRCLFVEYPFQDQRVVSCEDREGKKITRPVKDLNEVRVHFGDDAVRDVLRNAKPYPVKGIYRLSQYPELPPVPVFETGWWTLDKHLKLFAGEFMVVTGIPSHGKSTWVLNLLVNLAETHGWRSVIFSPEMPTVPHLRDKLRRIRLRGRALDWEATALADQWINENILFIDADPSGREDEEFDLNWIIQRATDAVLRDGIRVLVIDPWNEIEHARRSNETMTEYIGRSIRALKRFAQLYGVACIIVAHPTKDVARDGKSRAPTLYDIDGSAHFYNKCDHGIIIDRPDAERDESEIRVAKVRFEESGDKGMIRLSFRRESSRFETINSSVPWEKPQ